jgi:hypothetical protein
VGGAMTKRCGGGWLIGLVLWWPWTVSMVTWIGALVLLGFDVLPELMTALSTAGMAGVIVTSNHFSRARGPKLYGTKMPKHRGATISRKTVTFALLVALGIGVPLMVVTVMTR